MIAVVIIGIPPRSSHPCDRRLHDAKASAAKQDVATLVQSLTMYKLDNGRFPTGEQGLKALVEKPLAAPQPNNNWRSGGYIARLPNDPWGNPYQLPILACTAKLTSSASWRRRQGGRRWRERRHRLLESVSAGRSGARSGFSLIEVLVATTILATGLIAASAPRWWRPLIRHPARPHAGPLGGAQHAGRDSPAVAAGCGW